jgi:moderate conductance mechanosensitive channel
MTQTATERSICLNSPATCRAVDARFRHCLIQAAGPLCARLARLAIVLLLAAGSSAASANAQETPDPNSSQSSEVQLFLDLLQDPEVRAWIEEQRQGAPTVETEPAAEPMMSPHLVSSRIDRIRQNLSALATAIPRLPGELERVRTILSLELEDTGPIRTVILFALFVLLGFGLELLYR